MKKKLQNILSLVLILMTGTFRVSAQDIARDLECMRSAYQTLDKYYSELRVEIYARGKTTPAMVQKGVVRKDGNRYLYDFDGTKMLYNDEVILVLNEKQKFAMLNDRGEQPDLSELLSGQSANMDSLVGLCDSVRYHGMKEGLKHYTVYSARQTIQRTDLWIHDGTSLLVKMEYLYDKRLYPEMNRVQVRFDNMDTKPRFEKQLFSERRFLKGSPGKYQLKPPYESYELILSQTEEK